jgi:hypothetical protein
LSWAESEGFSHEGTKAQRSVKNNSLVLRLRVKEFPLCLRATKFFVPLCLRGNKILRAFVPWWQKNPSCLRVFVAKKHCGLAAGSLPACEHRMTTSEQPWQRVASQEPWCAHSIRAQSLRNIDRQQSRSQ